MHEFTEYIPTTENYFRSVVLFGRMNLTYKLVTAKSLLLAAKEGTQYIEAYDFCQFVMGELCERHKLYPNVYRQHGRFQGIRQFNAGDVSYDSMMRHWCESWVHDYASGGFHLVGQERLGISFFQTESSFKFSRAGFDCRHPLLGGRSLVRLTEEMLELGEDENLCNSLLAETEARWRLVETALELRIAKSLLAIDYDCNSHDLFSLRNSGRRVGLTSCRSALNGYQKGKCFYCFSDISVDECSTEYSDVDHFFPHCLKPHGFQTRINQIWNLVLCCRECNRGSGGKFATIPALKYLERLDRRNTFLINSYHPLRDTLIAQTGRTQAARRKFLQATYNEAKALLPGSWASSREGETAF